MSSASYDSGTALGRTCSHGIVRVGAVDSTSRTPVTTRDAGTAGGNHAVADEDDLDRNETGSPAGRRHRARGGESRLASWALVAALAGCSAEGQFVHDPEASPGARTSSAPSLPPGFTLGEREWMATSYGVDRKSAVVRTVEDGCTRFSHFEAREVEGSVQLVVYVALPPRGATCTGDLRTPPHTVQLPRVLAPNETLLDGCPAAPPPSPPVSPDDTCGTLRSLGHTPAT